MNKHKSYLDRLYVATPCYADWDTMAGDDRVRFCDRCKLHVYNISMMTKPQAEALIVETGGRLCTKFYRRADGSILTQDCPVGLRAIRRRVSQYAGATLSALLSFTTIGAVRLPTFAQDSQSCKHELKIKKSKSKSQSEQIVLVGTVYDVTKAVIPGAKVILVNERTEESRSLETSDDGSFRFSNVKTGSYMLVAEMRGFEIFRKKHIEIEGDENLELGITLHAGSVGGAAFLPKKQSAIKSA